MACLINGTSILFALHTQGTAFSLQHLKEIIFSPHCAELDDVCAELRQEANGWAFIGYRKGYMKFGQV